MMKINITTTDPLILTSRFAEITVFYVGYSAAYTYGSKDGEHVRAAVVAIRRRLPRHASIFQPN